MGRLYSVLEGSTHMSAGLLPLVIESGAVLGGGGLRFRFVGSERTLNDLTNWTIRSRAAEELGAGTEVFDFKEDGKHLINGLTDGLVELHVDSEESKDFGSNSDMENGVRWLMELVSCAPTQRVDGSSNAVTVDAEDGSTGFGKITLNSGITPLTVGAIVRISGSENSGENDGSYQVAGLADGAAADPTGTVFYTTRPLAADNASDTTMLIKELVLDETLIHRAVEGPVRYSKKVGTA